MRTLSAVCWGLPGHRPLILGERAELHWGCSPERPLSRLCWDRPPGHLPCLAAHPPQPLFPDLFSWGPPERGTPMVLPLAPSRMVQTLCRCPQMPLLDSPSIWHCPPPRPPTPTQASPSHCLASAPSLPPNPRSGLTQSPTPAPRGPGTWGARGALGTESDGAGSSTEQQATSKEQRERELAASAFQELDDDMDGA